MWTLFLMLNQLFNFDKDMAREILAGVDRLATTVFAACNVELVLPVVIGLVIVVERAQKDLLTNRIFDFCHQSLFCHFFLIFNYDTNSTSLK